MSIKKGSDYTIKLKRGHWDLKEHSALKIKKEPKETVEAKDTSPKPPSQKNNFFLLGMIVLTIGGIIYLLVQLLNPNMQQTGPAQKVPTQIQYTIQASSPKLPLEIPIYRLTHSSASNEDMITRAQSLNFSHPQPQYQDFGTDSAQVAGESAEGKSLAQDWEGNRLQLEKTGKWLKMYDFGVFIYLNNDAPKTSAVDLPPEQLREAALNWVNAMKLNQQSPLTWKYTRVSTNPGGGISNIPQNFTSQFSKVYYTYLSAYFDGIPMNISGLIMMTPDGQVFHANFPYWGLKAEKVGQGMPKTVEEAVNEVLQKKEFKLDERSHHTLEITDVSLKYDINLVLSEAPQLYYLIDGRFDNGSTFHEKVLVLKNNL